MGWHKCCFGPRMTSQELRDRTMAFGVEVFKFVRPLFHSADTRNVAGQLLDCATSVGANYRAAGNARSEKEWCAKLGLVVEEADESQFWLLFIKLTGLRVNEPSALAYLMDEAGQLTRIFGAALRTSRNKGGRKSRRA